MPIVQEIARYFKKVQLEVFEKMDIVEFMQAFALWRSRWHVILLFLLWGLTPAVWANGNKEATYKEAKGSQTFSGTIDLTDQKAGTYNVVIKTTDQAGNVTSHNKVEKASILIDGMSKTLVDIDEKGYFQ